MVDALRLSRRRVQTPGERLWAAMFALDFAVMYNATRVIHEGIAVHRRGAGPPIVLCHGNSCSSRGFRRQFEGPLAKQFSLFAVDLPGHGDSERSSTPDETYTLPGYAESVLGAVRELGIADALFIGWSLGAHVLLEASDRLPDASGFMLIGAPPVRTFAAFVTKVVDPAVVAPAFRAESTDDDVRALVTRFVRPGGEVPSEFFEDFRRTDPRARECLAASAGREELRDEIQAVASLSRPMAVVHGTGEQIIRRDAYDTIFMPTLWKGAVQYISDAGHAPHWENPLVFDRLVQEFANDCRTR